MKKITGLLVAFFIAILHGYTQTNYQSLLKPLSFPLSNKALLDCTPKVTIPVSQNRVQQMGTQYPDPPGYHYPMPVKDTDMEIQNEAERIIKILSSGVINDPSYSPGGLSASLLRDNARFSLL